MYDTDGDHDGYMFKIILLFIILSLYFNFFGILLNFHIQLLHQNGKIHIIFQVLTIILKMAKQILQR